MRPRIAVALFGPQGQGSFNESGLQGAIRARAAGHEVAVHWIASPEPSARAQALRHLCQQGLDLLVAHGGQGDAPVAAVCDKFAGTRFAITQGSHLSANTACYEVLQEHSAFLAGILAGLASKTRVVGHLSGEKVRPGLKGRAAFAHGLRTAAPDCRFVTIFCGYQHDPQLAYRAARALQQEGADLVFAMIDGGRDGVSQVCRETELRQIGNVLDWVERDPAVFVASALADSGLGVVQAIQDFQDGRFAPGSKKTYGLEFEQSVSLVMSPPLSAAHGQAIAQWRSQLISGQLHPDETYEGPELSLGV